MLTKFCRGGILCIFVRMKTEHYIAQLLYRYPCVTVPGFGAFLTEIQPAQLGPDTNSFFPPKKVISFNSYLKHNDGLLANHISLQEKITYEDAVEKISAVVTFWKSKLQNKGSIDLKNIGIIALNYEGNIVFIPSEEVNYLTSSFGLPAYVSPIIKREILLHTQEEAVVVNTTPKKQRNYDYLKYAAVFVVTVGLTGVFGHQFYQKRVDQETKMVREEVQKDVVNKIQEATFFIQNPLPNVTLTLKEAKKPYHIVIGSFKNEKNAKKIFKNLQRSGYEPVILEKNSFGLFPVLSGSFTNYSDAVDALGKVQKKINKDAWLMIKDL